jgi:hypothetical protein
MKIALCISGHLRDGDKFTFPSLKKFMLDKYDCDVFMSTWYENGSDVQFVHQSDIPKTNEMPDIRDRLLTYHPIDIKIDSSASYWIGGLKKQWNGVLTRNGSQLFQNNCMFYKIYDADHSRRMFTAMTGQKYDVVVRLRFDTELTQDIIEPTIDDIEAGKLIVRTGHCGIIDQLFWGKPEVVSAASECFIYLPQIVSSKNSKEFENAENILASYFGARGISLSIRDDVRFALTKPHGKHMV